MWSVDCHAPFALQLSLLLPSGPKHHGFPFHNYLQSKSWPLWKSKVKLCWLQKGRILAQPLSRCQSHVVDGCVWLSPGMRRQCSRLSQGRACQREPEERLRTLKQDVSVFLLLPFWAAYNTACSSVSSTQIKSHGGMFLFVLLNGKSEIT